MKRRGAKAMGCTCREAYTDASSALAGSDGVARRAAGAEGELLSWQPLPRPAKTACGAGAGVGVAREAEVLRSKCKPCAGTPALRGTRSGRRLSASAVRDARCSSEWQRRYSSCLSPASTEHCSYVRHATLLSTCAHFEVEAMSVGHARDDFSLKECPFFAQDAALDGYDASKSDIWSCGVILCAAAAPIAARASRNFCTACPHGDSTQCSCDFTFYNSVASPMLSSLPATA
eukprot:4682106-Pleurochrysis_carterae.AAC.1